MTARQTIEARLGYPWPPNADAIQGPAAGDQAAGNRNDQSEENAMTEAQDAADDDIERLRELVASLRTANAEMAETIRELQARVAEFEAVIQHEIKRSRRHLAQSTLDAIPTADKKG